MTLDDITAITVVYRTPKIFTTAYLSFRKFYPKVKLLVVDNSCRSLECEMISATFQGDPRGEYLGQADNLGHGIGMDLAIRKADTKFCYLFDSDVEMLSGGLLEYFLGRSDDPFYAMGRMLMVDEGGIDHENYPQGFEYIHPSIMFLDRERYLAGPAFIRHGAPCIKAMKHFSHSGLLIPILKDTMEQYAHHHGRMTRKHKGIEGLVIW
jgi:GT2 family glycosyltransferase